VLLCGELQQEPLVHLQQIIREVYTPLLDHPANQSGWGDVAAKEIMDNLNLLQSHVSIMLSQTEGKTCLPLPSASAKDTKDSGEEQRPGSTKDRIHLLEGAVITWTRQIKNVLKTDPEGMLKQGLNPTPDEELAFWVAKSGNLNSIVEQLNGGDIRRVLRFLDDSKSTYCNPFTKLCREVFTARAEANDNVKFLRTLETWFQQLNDPGGDFRALTDLCKPIMHIVLLIWKNSKFYNTPARLVVLMREMCNALIKQACNFVSGKQIFELLGDDQAHVAVEQLKTTLVVCSTFKGTYFDYKATANAECPNNPWRVQNLALFMRLDSFLERCHDILDLCQTIVQFTKLSKIEIGGTKGKNLTATVKQIYGDFELAVARFSSVDYDIMEVNVKQFDDDFYEFRCSIKELERRLGSVLTTAFDDTATITGRFKLLDLFDGLLTRPIIQDELEKKHAALVQAIGHDIKVVQELFLSYRDAPPIATNMPPISGALDWCRGLVTRIQQPMDCLRRLHKSSMEREEAKEVNKLFVSLMTSLEEYKMQKIEEWGRDVETSSQAKLKLPLLKQDKETRLLAVNFDKDLTKLLREVKYFLHLNLSVPDSALQIYKKAEVFRQQTGNLALVVTDFNNMLTTLLPVEEPLVRGHLDKIEKTVARGVNQMNWKSHGIDFFVTECMACVKVAKDILGALKDCRDGIEGIMEEWTQDPLLHRFPKPVGIQEFEAEHKSTKTHRYKAISDGGKHIHHLVKESNKALKVSHGLPDWKAYVDFVNDMVVGGLVEVVVTSLEFLQLQIGSATGDVVPMLEVDLDLIREDVTFTPPLSESPGGDGLRDIVDTWISSFFHVGSIFKRLDTGAGSYSKELQGNMRICALLAIIDDDMTRNEEACREFEETYRSFEYLWKPDIPIEFAKFIEEATDGHTDLGRPIMNLGKFDAEITRYRDIQEEINDLRTPADIGWLRVNSRPVKLALGTWDTKWVYEFTEYLSKMVIDTLNNLEVFMERTNSGLESKDEGVVIPREELMDSMACIRDVKKVMDETRDSFAVLRDSVALLKTHGIQFDGVKIGGGPKNPAEGDAPEEGAEVLPSTPLAEYLENVPFTWEALEKKMVEKREELLPVVNKESDEIKTRVDAFFLEMRAFRNDFRKNAPFEELKGEETPAGVYELLGTYNAARIEKEREAKEFNDLEELFELNVSKYDEPKDTLVELVMLKKCWDYKVLVDSTFADWSTQMWLDIDTEKLDDSNKIILKELRKFANDNQLVKGWGVYKAVETSVKNMAIVLPLVNELHAPSMEARHWKALSMVCQSKTIDPADPKLSLAELLGLELHLHADDVAEIVDMANKEGKVDKKLKMIGNTWGGLELDFVQHGETEIMTMKVSDEVVEFLEAHQLELQGMISQGKSVNFFRTRVTGWQTTLGNCESVIKEWSSVCKTWGSLESIFLASADIRAQLPEDTKRFEGIDQEFKDLMKEATNTPNVVEACTAEGREEGLKSMTARLEICQKSLNEYLDMKKKIFPRFYFVSDKALLDILSNGNNPPKIMPHLGSCYGDMEILIFKELEDGSKSTTEAIAMVAKDGERVEFETPFVIAGAVENWLNDLTAKMNRCLKFHMFEGMSSATAWDEVGEKDRHEWLDDYCAQVVLQVTTAIWTEETDSALEYLQEGNEDAVTKYVVEQDARLKALIVRVRGNLSKADRKKVMTTITLDVHALDCNRGLIEMKTEGPEAFAWKKQLRFQWIPETRDVAVQICDYKTLNSYEWVGNTGRLAITPLTDRCYITLTTALRLMLGGAPAGPAGTGKTETTKDLARAVGLQCYVFNCSSQMDYQGLGNIFKGLSQSGTWGCFDEFNRISIEVLSVVATQVKTVQDAVVRFSVPANRDEAVIALFEAAPAAVKEIRLPPLTVGNFDFFGDNISLIPTTASYITMNPGYAGRTELPENVKALFRSCSMIRPDLRIIMENFMLGEGFEKASKLSFKFFELYDLSSKLLSKQHHYDWGLRAVKSVLNFAGTLKRAFPELDEEPVLMRALRDFNTPKIPANDMPIFLRLIADLFPEYSDKFPPLVNAEIKALCVTACQEDGLQPEEPFIVKVVQFQELLDVRHSVMLLGPTGCAKSTIWRMLSACNNVRARNAGEKKRIAVYETVNPKAVSGHELFGYMTMAKDWKDGLLSIIMRGMSSNSRDQGYHKYQTHKWVCLDGDVDAVWIESMNTVMDDNKVLTLVSNERIPLTDAMRMVFEVNSLANASPATVTRAGILYINEHDVGWRPMVDSWIAKLVDDVDRATLPALFSKYVDNLNEGLRKLKRITPVRIITIAGTIMGCLDSWLPQIPTEKKNAVILENMFVFAAVWAFGGSYGRDKQNDFRKEFDMYFQATFREVEFPKETEVYDSYYNFKSLAWEPWSNMVEEYVPTPIGSGPGETAFGNIVVQSVASVQNSYILKSLVNSGRHALLVGGAGTGKTALIRNYFDHVDEDYQTCTISMSYFSDSMSTQTEIEAPIDKLSGRKFGPPPGKKLIFFVDDLNLPYIEEYGTQNAHSLITQHLCWGSFYDRHDLSLKKEIVASQYISAMNPTSGSFTVCERLQRHFSVLACLMPDATDLTTIFSSILNGHLSGFSQKMQALSGEIVKASIQLHDTICVKYLPSALNFIYNWNMRELANVFQGLCLAKPEFYPHPTLFLRLWTHECHRVFQDRMRTEMDIDMFDGLINDQVKKMEIDVELDAIMEQPNIYTSFATQSNTPTYLPIKSMDDLHRVIKQSLDEYNDSNNIMDLVLFKDAMEHITRIARIIRLPSGNALLIGVGGSGKQSLSRLASYICGFEVMQLSVTSKFSVEDLKEALRAIYMKAGVKGVPTSFILTDSQIVNEKFLVFVNGILTSGWIPGLFAKEDMEGVYAGLRSAAKAAAVPDTPDAMTTFFVERIRSNLHTILCFSPVGDLIRVRARRFPGLVNCTAIDWFHPWSTEALVSVAQRFLVDVELNTPEIKDNMAHHMAVVHQSVSGIKEQYFRSTRRHVYVTPKSFLELIEFYKHLLSTKREELGVKIDRLDVGLSTLRKTASDVAELQKDLNFTMVKVREKQAATEILLESMGKQRGEAEIMQAAAKIEMDLAETATAEAKVIEKSANEELAKATPAMERAAAALEGLEVAKIKEFSGYSKEPRGGTLVTGACQMMLDGEYKKHTWDLGQKMMRKADEFKQRLLEFDSKHMDDKLVKALGLLVADEENFSVAGMTSVSQAAGNITDFVINTYQFNRIYVNFEPLLKSRDEARAKKAAAEEAAAAANAQVAEVNAKLDELQKTFMNATEEKAAVEAEAKANEDRLGLAVRLVGGLQSENDRWGKDIELLKTADIMLVGDAMLAASFVSYIGSFNAQFRKQLGDDIWLQDILNREIPITAELDPLTILSDEGRIAQMQSEGLPSDRISTENGVIISQCKRWPLIIDPQVQGIKWLRQKYEGAIAKVKELEAAAMEAAAGAAGEAKGDALVMDDGTGGEHESDVKQAQPFNVIQTSQKNWVRAIGNAIQMGEAIIIENCGEDIDPTLDPVLARAIIKRGRAFFINFGGEEIEYHKDFQMYLLTKLDNPHYKPELAAQCTIINFVATEAGLEDQLLAKMVGKEKPELEKRKADLMETFNRFKIQLLELEDQLLERLANAPDDILSDVPLIEGLEATKAAVTEINAATVIARETEKAIDLAREMYRKPASESSMLYFMLTGFNVVDHMYSYSLDAFVFFFFKAIDAAPPSEDINERVGLLIQSLRMTIFTWVVRGLFERHKLLVLSQLAFMLMRRGALEEEMDYPAFHFLLHGDQRIGAEMPAEVPWITQNQWEALVALGDLEAFAALPGDIKDAPGRFEEWYNHVSPETQKLPLNWSGLDKTPFLKLLVVRCLRPDRLGPATQNWVREALPKGGEYVDCDGTLNAYQILESSLADSSNTTPIYFILSPGADVVADVDQAAESRGLEKGVSYHNVSMGQGQDVVAMTFLEMGHKQGHWVILNNVHLMPVWCIALEQKLDAFKLEGSHERFRVFLTSDPSEGIPFGILSRSIKLTNEPPAGLKANLKRAWGNNSRDDIEESDARTKSILFCLCQFHSVLMERKRYGPKGYNIMYPFSLGDLRDSTKVFRNYMENAPSKIPWEDLRYIFGEIMYGGHVVDDLDRELVLTYLDHYMRDELFDEMELFPFADGAGVSLKSPPTMNYDGYFQYIEDKVVAETPIAFGLHPNAEIGFRTESSLAL
jgi:dynein heavy chain